MDSIKLTAIISLLLALSIASERLVEIVKGLIPALNLENNNPVKEGWRRCILQILAMASGILTAFLARDSVPKELFDMTTDWSVVALGLLASGGSGFWNSILTYLSKVKDIKAIDVEKLKKDNPAVGENTPGNP